MNHMLKRIVNRTAQRTLLALGASTLLACSLSGCDSASGSTAQSSTAASAKSTPTTATAATGLIARTSSTAETSTTEVSSTPAIATTAATVVATSVTSSMAPATTAVASSAAPTTVASPVAASTSAKASTTTTAAPVATTAASSSAKSTATTAAPVATPVASSPSKTTTPPVSTTPVATPPSTVTTAPVSSTPVATPPSSTSSTVIGKSISAWTTCDGITDDSAGLARAFAAAKNSAFTLLIDCPVRLKIGMDMGHTIFIDNGTTVVFTGAGKFTIDNTFIPAFVIANSSNITLTDWNVEYDASLPVNNNVGGYQENGVFFKQGNTQPANAFNDLRLTSWLAANRGIVFDSQHGVNSRWSGSTNACAVFYITGDSSNLTVTGMNIYAPAGATGSQLIPVVFSLNANYKSNQTLTTSMPYSSQFMALPHNLTFSNISIDGSYMGWVGNAHDVTMNAITSHRYGDLQDANGATVGGVGKWFAPPHLFYWSYSDATDPALVNNNIQIENVVDDGPRLGTARDKGGSDSISGYALSLKIACTNCTVDTYKSTRPDGFLDVLASSGLTISNATATYDSSFINNLFPGWRFPSAAYSNVTFKNIQLTDLAAVTMAMPIGNATQTNQNLTFSNVQVTMNSWGGQGLPLPSVYGNGNTVSLVYSLAKTTAQIVRLQTPNVETTIQATPTTLKVGGATTLVWSARQAESCTPSGAWSGISGMEGTRIISPPAAGTYTYTLTCANGANTSTAAVQVVVTQ